MTRVPFEMLKRSIRNLLDFGRQCLIADPKVRVGVMIQRGLVLPAAWSRSAFSAIASSLPARTSRSSCRSHRTQSNSRNHSRNWASSSGDSAFTCCSRSLTLLIGDPFKDQFSTSSKCCRLRGGLRRGEPRCERSDAVVAASGNTAMLEGATYDTRHLARCRRRAPQQQEEGCRRELPCSQFTYLINATLDLPVHKKNSGR